MASWEKWVSGTGKPDPLLLFQGWATERLLMTKRPEPTGVELQALTQQAVGVLVKLEIDLRDALAMANDGSDLAGRSGVILAALDEYKRGAKEFLDLSGRIEKYRTIIGERGSELDLASAEDEILARAARLGQSG